MATESDVLSLAARITDGWSGPLKRMQSAFRNTATDVGKGNRAIADSARTTEGRFFLLRREMGALAGTRIMFYGSWMQHTCPSGSSRT